MVGDRGKLARKGFLAGGKGGAGLPDGTNVDDVDFGNLHGENCGFKALRNSSREDGRNFREEKFKC